MVNYQIKTCKQATQKVTYKKASKTKNKKLTRNAKRRVRRRRNKFKYYQTLTKERTFKKSEELCEAVEVFDITDMEWTAGAGESTSQLPVEIIEWQKRDQIAYWKSKALSLELENKMLRQHLRNVYAKAIEDYTVHNQKNRGYIENESSQNTTDGREGNESIRSRKDRNSNKSDISKIAANFPDKNRSEELKKIYGDIAPKILGMETALQLNYERYLEKSKPSYWPNLPLKY